MADAVIDTKVRIGANYYLVEVTKGKLIFWEIRQYVDGKQTNVWIYTEYDTSPVGQDAKTNWEKL